MFSQDTLLISSQRKKTRSKRSLVNRQWIVLLFMDTPILFRQLYIRPSDQPKVKSMIKLGNMTYQITSDYKYLGIVLHEHLSYTQAAQMRIDHAMKVFWSLCAHTTDMSATVFKKLYDSLITTVLDYGATIWFHQIPDSGESSKQSIKILFRGRYTSPITSNKR